MRSRVDNGRRFAAVSGGLLAVLLGMSSCNSLLGINEASLTCDFPPCDIEGTGGAGARGAMSGRSAAGAVDDGAAPEGASGSSNTIGAMAVPEISGAGSEGIPVLPGVPLQGAGTRDAGSGSDGADNGSSGAGGLSGAGGASGFGGLPGAGGEPGQALCNSGDACGACLCDACEPVMTVCIGTPGCLEILACARNSDCFGFACYCGTVDLIQCATTDLANGPCLAMMLAAPGSHPPSLVDPNAGPASEAALDVANCSGQSCVVACGN
jgi:hypothetical protein